MNFIQRLIWSWLGYRNVAGETLQNKYKSEWQNYLCWRDKQSCIDCGRPFLSGGFWTTETQCFDCFIRLGNTSMRAMPEAADLYDGNLHILIGNK